MKKNYSIYSHHDQQYIARRETREELIAESLVNGFSLSLSLFLCLSLPSVRLT